MNLHTISILSYPLKEVHPNLTDLVQVSNNKHIYDFSEFSPLIQKQCISALRRYYKYQRLFDVTQTWHIPFDYLISWKPDGNNIPMAKPYRGSPHYYHSSPNGTFYTSKALALLPPNMPLLTFNYCGFLSPSLLDKYFTKAIKLALRKHLMDYRLTH